MKKFVSLLLAVLLVLSLVGCKDDGDKVIVLDELPDSSNDSATQDNTPVVQPDNDNDDASGIPDEPDTDDPYDDLPDDSDPIEDAQPDVTLYFSDDTGTSFIAFSTTVASVEANNLVSALSNVGVLDSKVSVNGFSTVTDGNQTILKLDLNSAFASQLAECGQGYGYMLIGSVVNTFLDAFDADAVSLTASGKTLTADEKTYSGYLTTFGSNPNPPTGEEEVPDEPVEPDVSADENPVVATALSLLGAPYEYGASGPNTFDNSGFVYYCFKANGIDIPRRTSAMFLEGKPVNKKDLQKGDVVFFSFDGSTTNPTYTAIYIGDGQAIAESNENNPVSTFKISLAYYSDSYVGARRYS